MSFAREAWPFVLPFVVLGAGLLVFKHPAWGIASLVLGLLVLLFFRDPHRRFEGEDDIVLAAADGVVTQVDTVEDASVGPGRFQRVVTFLSVFDVHVQRVPTSGEVVASSLARGRKVAAFKVNADEVNELHLTVIERPDGARVGVKQIVGLLARRVVCYLEIGQRIERGQHLGLIKFGSRVDVLVPESWEILVKKGDRMKNGATPLARIPAAPP